MSYLKGKESVFHEDFWDLRIKWWSIWPTLPIGGVQFFYFSCCPYYITYCLLIYKYMKYINIIIHIIYINTYRYFITKLHSKHTVTFRYWHLAWPSPFYRIGKDRNLPLPSHPLGATCEPMTSGFNQSDALVQDLNIEQVRQIGRRG